MAPRVGLTYRLEQKAVPYRAALQAVGLEAVNLTPEAPASLAGLSGLMLTGGSDIEPWRYGQDDIAARSPDGPRDEMELRLAGEAIELGMPLFAICRGMQVLNVLRGGKLLQHIGEEHTGVMHGVKISDGSLLRGILGCEYQVNSRHHQAAARLGDGLIATAVSEDGHVEALELPSARGFVLGVQWHPEDLYESDAGHLRLFEAFRDAVIHWKR
ncbi:gamma-glutamyl-gamma-aminobutyrate hydrolase family protein [Paludibaculum fermentans]|uniref:Gamma-glutamyl-gamma-aminobutyrate hydrolase family protein n=1 Tax=Paludibaculum fermentans TaxID=1473598 RepID=A0A7S7SJ79_PALFE|nr:gamma-glutamyl-gamma-aminobutyrate hydrolase family protein [Paludibaculum fermentans]QOY86196.1 gamma-glutamyl-gamma-aminobutyrate hydrolase family protein [Paludibaculum fermentans]